MTQTMDTQMKQISVATDVLVVGGGYAGLSTALNIADAGYRAILVANGDALENSDSATLTGIDDAGKEALGRLAKQAAAEERGGTAARDPLRRRRRCGRRIYGLARRRESRIRTKGRCGRGRRQSGDPGP